MKNDLATAIVVAILGVVIAYFGCNMFTGEIEPVSVKTVDSSFSTEIPEPDPELFNYKAINPTVEVYVGEGGDCRVYDSNGECIYDSGQETPAENDNQETP
jgi:hypothetical protein